MTEKKHRPKHPRSSREMWGPTRAARALAKLEKMQKQENRNEIRHGESLEALRSAFPEYSPASLSTLLGRARRTLGIQNGKITGKPRRNS